MKKVFKKWVLTDYKNNLIVEGRKKDVVKVMYQRYVYQHIFTDNLYKTNENI
jgi:hypothetical protein